MDAVSVVLLVVIIFLTITCNTFANLFYLRKRSESTLKDKLVALLCIMNACQTIAFIVELYGAITGHLTEGACKVEVTIICCFTYTSIGYYVQLAIERVTGIIYPYEFQAWYIENPNTKWLLLPPLAGFLLGLAPLMGWSGYGKHRDHSTYCGIDFGKNDVEAKSYYITIIIVFMIIPIILTSVCFACIIIILWRKVSQDKLQYGKVSPLTRDSLKSVVGQSISYILIAMLYMASWVPYIVVCFYFYSEVVVSHTLEYVAIYMAKSSTISSAVIYCLIEKPFRKFAGDHMPRLRPLAVPMELNKPNAVISHAYDNPNPSAASEGSGEDANAFNLRPQNSRSDEVL